MDASKLTTYLECPVCFLIPRSKIFACFNGHKICYTKMKSQVNTRTKLCPQGGCSYDRPPRRLRDLEIIVENADVKLNCSNAECRVELIKDKLEKHEAQCEYRTVPCPETSCEMEVSFRKIAGHIKNEHKNHVIIKESRKPVIKVAVENFVDWNLGVLNLSSKNGIVQFYPQIVNREEFWYCWVKIKGDSNDAANWKFSVKAENQETGIRMEFSGPVHPVDLTVDQVIESGDCLQMNRKNVDKLKDADEMIEIVLDLASKYKLHNHVSGSKNSEHPSAEESAGPSGNVKNPSLTTGQCPLCGREMTLPLLIKHAAVCDGPAQGES